MPEARSDLQKDGVLFGLPFPALRRWGLNESETATLAAVLVLVALVCARSLWNGFVYDDLPQIVFNRALHHWSFAWLAWTHDVWWFRDPQNLPQSPYYRPLQNVFFALAFRIAGKSPVMWHLVKLALHLVVVVLTFRLGQLLTGNVATSLLTSLLFGVLAVHAEPVVWVSAISEPLMAIFEVAALCSFIRRPSASFSGLALPIALFALAVFTQESAILFPILVAAYVFLLEPVGNEDEAGEGARHSSSSLSSRVVRAVLLAAPLVAVDFFYMGVRLLVLGKTAVLGMTHTAGMLDLVGNKVVIHEIVVNPRALQILTTLPIVIATYLETFVLPWLAGPAHPVGFVKVRGLENFYQPLGILLLLVVIGYLTLRRSGHANFYLFCVVWWLVCLAPALSLNQIISLVQDRYQYVASIGLCLLVADVAVTLAGNGEYWRRAIEFGMGVMIVLQVVALWRVQPIWHDDRTLFAKCVEILPGSVYYREQYAGTFESRGDLKGAAEQLAAAADSAGPGDYVIHYQLGQLYLRMGRKAEAQQEFRAYLKAFAPWALGGGSKSQAVPQHE